MPIFAAPMGFITGPELAAAVSNAGGLGIMSFSANPTPVLREQIRRLRSLTNRPFGVNVLLNGPHLPFPIDAVVDVCLEEHVPVLSTFWGDPTPYVARAGKNSRPRWCSTSSPKRMGCRCMSKS